MSKKNPKTKKQHHIQINHSISIYHRTRFSSVNQFLVNRYSLFLAVSKVILAITFVMELGRIFGCWSLLDFLKGNCIYGAAVWIKNGFLFLHNHFHNTFEQNRWTLFSIIVSLLSVMAATFAIAFGNFKICSINANLVLKQIYGGGKKRISTRIVGVMLVTPFGMLFSIGFHFDVLFVFIFLFAFINLFYLLDICLTIFTDNGVKYVEIPKNLSRELQQSVHLSKKEKDSSEKERERLLYDSFVQNISCDDYSVNKIVVPSVVLDLVRLEYLPEAQSITKDEESQKNKWLHAIYRNTYQFFYDIRRYLYRNTVDKKDFLDAYFNLCSATAFAIETQYQNKDIDTSEYMSVCLAIFRNAVETLHMNEAKEYGKAFDEHFTKMLKTLYYQLKAPDSDTPEKRIIEIAICIIFQMECEFSTLIVSRSASCQNAKNAIQFLFFGIFSCFSVMIRPKGIVEADPDNKDVAEIKQTAKDLFVKMSTGLVRQDYIHQMDTQFVLRCVNNIINDINLYIIPDSMLSHQTVSLRSNLVFAYEAFSRGGNEG